MQKNNEMNPWMGASVLLGVLLLVSILTNAFVISKALNGAGSALPSQQGQVLAPTPSAPTPSAPSAPVQLSLGSAPVAGNKNAKVTVVEFSDFECPFCGRYYNDAYKQMKAEYIDTGKVQFAFKQFPLTSIHPNAQKAGEASLCAHEQGKFWEYHDVLFANQRALSIDQLKTYAANLNLDTSKFNTCLDSSKYAAQVQAETSEGEAAGVSGTPTTFVNGVRIVGAVPYAQIKAQIDAALAE